MEGCPLAALRGEEVAALLARQPADDDAADAHRAGARQSLRVDAGADDEDRAGQPDVQGRGAQPPVPDVATIRAEREATGRRVAERLDPRHHPALSFHADRDARADLADDPGNGTVDGLLVLAGRDGPAPAVLEDELAALDCRAATQPARSGGGVPAPPRTRVLRGRRAGQIDEP